MDQMVVRVARGSSTAQRDGPGGFSRISVNGSAKFCTCGVQYTPVCLGGQLAGKQLFRKVPGGPGGQQVDHGAATCISSKKGQQPPGLR